MLIEERRQHVLAMINRDGRVLVFEAFRYVWDFPDLPSEKNLPAYHYDRACIASFRQSYRCDQCSQYCKRASEQTNTNFEVMLTGECFEELLLPRRSPCRETRSRDIYADIFFLT